MVGEVEKRWLVCVRHVDDQETGSVTVSRKRWTGGGDDVERGWDCGGRLRSYTERARRMFVAEHR